MATIPASGVLSSTAETIKPYAHGRQPFVIERTFNLTSLSAVLANADVVNLLELPANTHILGAGVRITVAGTQTGGGTFTGALRVGTTALVNAADFLTKDTLVCNTGTVSAGNAAAKVNLLIAQTTGTVTANPTVKVTLTCVDVS